MFVYDAAEIFHKSCSRLLYLIELNRHLLLSFTFLLVERNDFNLDMINCKNCCLVSNHKEEVGISFTQTHQLHYSFSFFYSVAGSPEQLLNCSNYVLSVICCC